MSDSMVGLADLNFPGHSLWTLLLTCAGICSRYFFAKMSYKRKRLSYDASFIICMIEHVFLEQIKEVDLYMVLNFGRHLDL